MDLNGKICAHCINKHITEENRLFCWKGINTSNVESVCTDFSSVVMKDRFILKNKIESYSENKIKLFFLICFLLPVAFLVLIFSFIIGLNFNSFIIDLDFNSFFFILAIIAVEFILIISLYKGKKWAKTLLNVLISINVFGSFYTLGAFETSSDVLITIFSVVFNMYILYFINIDKDFKLFFKSKN